MRLVYCITEALLSQLLTEVKDSSKQKILLDFEKLEDERLLEEKIQNSETFLDYLERRIEEAREKEMKMHFDFEINETLSVEKIIRATFANPNRRKFVHSTSPWGSDHRLCPDNIDPEILIQTISSIIPRALSKFTQKQIQLYDTSQIDSKAADKVQWPANLKSLKWYGPFLSLEDNYMFQTTSSLGYFEGLLLDIHLNSNKCIYLSFLDKESDSCGEPYEFNNR